MNTHVSGSLRVLSDLPSISIVLADDLRRVGITSPAQLVAIGAEEAWLRLRADGQHDCIHALLALGGAVLGVEWQALPSQRRFELMRFAAQTMAAPRTVIKAAGPGEASKAA